MKNEDAATTILGPAGVSHCSEPYRPPKTAMMPTMAAINAICSGPLANRRAMAAGKISMEVISKTPTIFMEIAITAAINIMKIIFACSGFMSSAWASSRFTVAANKDCQNTTKMIKTNNPPPQMTAISNGVTANMSPKRKPIKSTLTQVIKLNATMPTAKAEWASRPSNASAERVIRLFKSTSARETKTDTEKTLNGILT